MEVIDIHSEAFQQIMTTLKDVQNQLERFNNRRAGLEEEYVNTNEACRLLKICRKTMEKYRAENSIPYSKMDRKIFYKISDLEKFMESMRKAKVKSRFNS